MRAEPRKATSKSAMAARARMLLTADLGWLEGVPLIAPLSAGGVRWLAPAALSRRGQPRRPGIEKGAASLLWCRTRSLGGLVLVPEHEVAFEAVDLDLDPIRWRYIRLMKH